MVGDQPHGQAVRVAEGKLLLTRHQIDVMSKQAFGDVSISNGLKKYPLSRIEIADDLVDTADAVTIKISPSAFSALGVRVAKIGFATPGPALVYSRNEIGQSIVSVGRLSKSASGKTGVLAHNCHTQPGSSGAALVQDGFVVGLHTGSNPEKTENLATSLRYFKSTILGKEEESYFADDKFDIDVENDKVSALLHSYQVGHPGNSSEYLAADELWDEVQRLRYGEHHYDEDELEERLARIDLGEASERDVRQYLHTQGGIAFASKKNKTKGKESADIKAVGSQTLAVIASAKARSIPMVSASNTSAPPALLEPESRNGKTQPSSEPDKGPSTRDLQIQLSELSKQLSVLVTQNEERKPSSKVSDSKPQSSSPPKNATSKVSKEPSKKPSKAT